MKLNPRTVSLALLITLWTVALGAAEMRTWNLKTGKTIEAEIVAFPTPDTVKLKYANGKVYDVRAEYLSDADRAYLDEERAKQWKEVSVNKLLGAASAGRYKKCEVSGKEVNSEIYVTLLPAQAEAVLNARQQQEAQINELNNRIQSDTQDASAHKAAAKTGSYGYRRENRVEANQANQDKQDANISLTKLKSDYEANLKKTKSLTTVRIRNTGLVYEGLQVWECQAARR